MAVARGHWRCADSRCWSCRRLVGCAAEFFAAETWTQQFPAAAPSARFAAATAGDAATGTVVLFGGCNSSACLFDDTWTWNGSTWTKQAPATSCTTGQRRQ